MANGFRHTFQGGTDTWEVRLNDQGVLLITSKADPLLYTMFAPGQWAKIDCFLGKLKKDEEEYE